MNQKADNTPALSQTERELKQTADNAIHKWGRAEKKASCWRTIAVAALAGILTLTAVLLASHAAAEDVELSAIDPAVAVVKTASNEQNDAPSPPVDVQEDFENQKIEAALYASGYFRNDIPLDADTQSCLCAACDEFGVQFELALAVIHQETDYNNIPGDGGNSVGYMQVQFRWHKDRMVELGVTDLSNPYQNFRVGCSILAELLDKYGSETDALTAYNTGSPGNSAYAREVIAYENTLRKGAAK